MNQSITISFSFSQAPLVGLEDAQYEVTEDAGSQLICVQLLPGYTLHQPLSLTLTIDGEPLETQVTFPAASGPSRQCVSVDIVDDTVVEHDETMSVALSNSGGEYISILPSSATISVIDDDCELLSHQPYSHLLHRLFLSYTLCTIEDQ